MSATSDQRSRRGVPDDEGGRVLADPAAGHLHHGGLRRGVPPQGGPVRRHRAEPHPPQHHHAVLGTVLKQEEVRTGTTTDLGLERHFFTSMQSFHSGLWHSIT